MRLLLIFLLLYNAGLLVATNAAFLLLLLFLANASFPALAIACCYCFDTVALAAAFAVNFVICADASF